MSIFNKFKQIKDKIKANLNNTKGVLAVEAGVGIMILIIVVAGIVDFSNSNVQLSNVSTTTNYLSRIVSEQGGISNHRPSNYYDDIYTTSSEAFNFIDSHMRNNGIEDWELTITVGNTEHTFSPATSIGPLAYDTPVTIKLTFNYRLRLISGFINLGEIQKTSTRHVKTTLHPRNDELEVIL